MVLHRAHPRIDDGTEFHIVKFNFAVTAAPKTPFPGEQNRGPWLRRNQRLAAAVANGVNPLRVIGHDVVPNLGEGGDNTINELRRQRIDLDDDNEPAPENAEATAMNPGNGRFEKPTKCPRRMANINNAKGKFNSHHWEVIAKMNKIDQFRMCFPEQFVINVIIPKTNKHLGTAMTLQEFYVWLGCIFYMACFEGICDRDKWMTYVEDFFLDIMGAIRYTDIAQPLLFEDRFHEVRQMIGAFNQHFEREYSPAWLSCLDELMNSLLNKFCPGFMICPRKLHPFANEYHSIADSNKSGQHPIMWRVQLVEGKDQPKLENGRWAFPTNW